MAALAGIAGFGMPGTGFKGLMGSNLMKSALARGMVAPKPTSAGWLRRIWDATKGKRALTGAAALTLSPYLMSQEDEEEKLLAEAMNTGEDIFAKYGGVDKLRADAIAGRLKREEFPYQRTYSADGGRAGYEGGLLVNDDDDYVSPREAALAALYNPRRMADGGRIGYDN